MQDLELSHRADDFGAGRGSSLGKAPAGCRGLGLRRRLAVFVALVFEEDAESAVLG